MLQRNLLYTAITRARKLVVVVGTSKALAIAVKRVSSRRRITTLKERLAEAFAQGDLAQRDFDVLRAAEDPGDYRP
jgi:ATP-dependent exoDNAse (exonuclease V) alpha subunit